MIISFVHTKGGTGKTTLSHCLAYSKTFAKEFDSIALVELDAQGSLRDWHAERMKYFGEAEGNNSKTTYEELFADNFIDSPVGMKNGILKLLKKYDLLILDVPGESRSKFASRFAAALSDITFIPSRTSDKDENSFNSHVRPMVEEIIASQTNKENSFRIIPTMVSPNSNVQNIVDYFDLIKPDSLPTLSTLSAVLCSRGLFEQYSRSGFTLEEYSASVKRNKRDFEAASNAISDIEGIAKAILKAVKG